MRIFISVLMLLVPVPFAAAQSCPELQPTLRDYHIQKFGESYVNGNGIIPESRDGEMCEKTRYDLRTYFCRWRNAKGTVNNHHLRRLTKTDASGVPIIVKQAQASNPRQIVGGEAGKQRSIDGAWENYKGFRSEFLTAEKDMRQAESGYRKAAANLTKDGCTNGIFSKGRDPILKR